MESFTNSLSGQAEDDATEELRNLLNSNNKCKIATVMKYIHQGAKVDSQDNNGNTLLHHLIQSFDGDLTAIKELLYNYNANINIKNKDGKTPFDFLLDRSIFGKFERKGEAQLVVLASQQHINIGSDLYKQKQYINAIEAYKKAFNLGYEEASLHYNLGCAYMYNLDLDLAIDSFHAAIKLQPGYANAYYHLGCAWSRKNDHDKTIENVNKALEYHYKNKDYAYSVIAVAHVKKHDFSGAIDIYSKAIEINPRATYYYYRAKVYIMLNKPELAIKDFIKALTLNPNIEIASSLKRLLKDKEIDIFLVEKPEFIELIRLLPEDKKKEFLIYCRDRNTELGSRMYYPEGLLAKAMRLFSIDPENFAITKCSPEKGTLKQVNELLGEEDEPEIEENWGNEQEAIELKKLDNSLKKSY